MKKRMLLRVLLMDKLEFNVKDKNNLQESLGTMCFKKEFQIPVRNKTKKNKAIVPVTKRTICGNK